MSGFSHLSMLSVSSILFQKPWEQNGLLLLSFHCCGITEVSEGFAEVFWSITLMGSGHVWSWMWFWAKRCEWKGMKTDRVKHFRVKGWCRGRLWLDRHNYPGVLLALAGALRKWTAVCKSVIWYIKKKRTCTHAKKKIRQHGVRANLLSKKRHELKVWIC